MSAIAVDAVQTIDDVAMVDIGLRVTRLAVGMWSGECQMFLKWERSIMEKGAESPEELNLHGQAVKALLALGRAISTATEDPEFPDAQTASIVRGRLMQLKCSWSQFHDRLPEAQAKAILKEVFPDDPLVDQLFRDEARG